MKKNIFMIAFCLLSLSLFPQEKIAILPFTGGYEGEGDAIAQILGKEFTTKFENFKIIPHTQVIKKVMKEHKFQRDKLTDGDTIVELGKEINVKYVVSGHIHNLRNKKMILANIVDVETFQQVAGDYYEYDKLDEVVNYLPTLAGKLVSKIKKDYSKVPTLVILPFLGADESNEAVLMQLLTIELANSEKYKVISRTATIEKAMEEHNIQRNRLIDASSILKLEIAVNADYILYGSASSLDSTNFMNATIVNILNLLQQIGAYDEYKIAEYKTVEYTTIEEGIELMPKLSYKLTGVDESNKKTDHEFKKYKIGDTGPGGGTVFYIEDDKYFECSKLRGLTTWENAFILAKNYRGGGYNDWYLPSKEELNYIYEKDFISNNGRFWSSSEYHTDIAWFQDFNDGSQYYTYVKSRTTYVCVVRVF